MPELSESYSRMSNIYEEMHEEEKSLSFRLMFAYLQRTNVEAWKNCAYQAMNLQRYKQAIYCFNRAIKQTPVNPKNMDDLINMRFAKIEVYKLQNDFSSAVRAIEKIIAT
jgi:tetratricopeptide (TPR) repeat protein